jgi:hypothetical protein
MTLRDGNERKQVRAQAFVTTEKAAAIFAAAGNDFEKTRAAGSAVRLPGRRGFGARHHTGDQPGAQFRIAKRSRQDRRQ